MKSSHCEPRGSISDLTALVSGDLKTVITAAEKLIADGFVNIEAHATAAAVYAKLNEREKATTHFAITAALLRSITNSGDGKTEASAFEVICDREEYFVLSMLGLPYFGSSTSMMPIVNGTHHLERWEVQSPKTGQTVVVFFNIDAFSPTKSRVRSN